MKKTLAGLMAVTILAGAAIWSESSHAVPVTPPEIVVQQTHTQVQTQQVVAQQQGWSMPDQDDRKPSSVDPVAGDDGEPVIQVALLLDTSGSMDPLIDQAKTELWSVVNQLGEARYKGKIPKVEVALYEYGKSTIPADEGYLRQLAPFTNDLDAVSEILFGLTTNGGEEYCAWVMQSALNSLKWKQRPGSLRLIFIAGNEPFTQGPVQVAPVISKANEMGVMIHPIYCDAGYSNDQHSWQQAAVLAKTDLKVIDHTRMVQVPKTPYDDKLLVLGDKLNKTYVGYGQGGSAKIARQAAQDSNVGAVSPGAAAERAVTKASPSYNNSSWDLVDASREEGGLDRIDEADLPVELQGKDRAERQAFVKAKADERAKIQDEIQELNRKRQEFISKEQASNEQEASLGKAMVKSVKEKAEEQGFKL